MNIRIDDGWASDPLVFGVHCIGDNYNISRWMILNWLGDNFGKIDFSSSNYETWPWRYQVYIDQKNYCMFSITLKNQTDAMAFKLNWFEHYE